MTDGERNTIRAQWELVKIFPPVVSGMHRYGPDGLPTAGTPATSPCLMLFIASGFWRRARR